MKNERLYYVDDQERRYEITEKDFDKRGLYDHGLGKWGLPSLPGEKPQISWHSKDEIKTNKLLRQSFFSVIFPQHIERPVASTDAGIQDPGPGEPAFTREQFPQVLTKANFWDELCRKYPAELKPFCVWIDDYKTRPEWTYIFGRGVKFHHLPTAMQFGIFFQYTTETVHNVPLFDENNPGPLTMSEAVEWIGDYIDLDIHVGEEKKKADEQELKYYQETYGDEKGHEQLKNLHDKQNDAAV